MYFCITAYCTNMAHPLHRKEMIKVFAGFLKVYYYIVTGRPKTGKDELRELQKSIQLLAAQPDPPPGGEDDPEGFQWMTKDHLCILVYLVTVMHSMHTGLMERALKYTDKGIVLLCILDLIFTEYNSAQRQYPPQNTFPYQECHAGKCQKFEKCFCQVTSLWIPLHVFLYFPSLQPS